MLAVNAGQQSSPVLVMRSGVGSVGAMWFLQRGFWGQIILMCICAVSTVLGDFAPCPPSLPGKYEVSIMVPLLLQCDSVWWLPLTALSWLPYNLALVHRVVMVTLHTRFLCSRLHYLSRHLPQAHLLLMSLSMFGARERFTPTRYHPKRSKLQFQFCVL